MSGTSALDAIGALAGKKRASGKKAKELLTDPSLDRHINIWLAAKADEADAKGKRILAEGNILDVGCPAREDACRRAGSIVTSISINGRVTLSQDKRFSDIPEERAADLREAFGKEDSERFFTSKLKISLKEHAANDNAVLQKLIDAFGDSFGDIFEVTRSANVTDQFRLALATDQVTRSKCGPFLADRSLKPWKPSLKQA